MTHLAQVSLEEVERFVTAEEASEATVAFFGRKNGGWHGDFHQISLALDMGIVFFKFLKGVVSWAWGS